MKEKYKHLYSRALMHLKTIHADIIKIEKGVKEKSCFKPIINVMHLKLLAYELKLYIARLEKVIDLIEESEG